ncbi:MAG TPA: ABC transporter permease [Acidobacteria bacterium]|nr:ABC transporter permease [Acidobacteriota bacterium]
MAPRPDAASNRIVEALRAADYEVTTVPSWNESKPLPKTGYRVDLPPTPGTLLLSGGSGEIEVWSHDGDMDATRLEVTLNKAVLTLRAETLARLVRGEKPSLETLGQPLTVVPIRVRTTDWGERHEIPSGYKQVIPGNMVMFVLMSVLVTGAVRLLMDRELGHLRRMLASPISPAAVVVSQFLSLALLGIAEAVYFVLLGWLVFGQSPGPHPGAVLAVLALAVAATSGVGIILGATLKSAKQAAAVGIFATLALAALGGCWWPLEIVPRPMRVLALALPSGQTMRALIRLMVWNDPPSALLGYAAYMLIFALVAGALATTILRRRLVG